MMKHFTLLPLLLLATNLLAAPAGMTDNPNDVWKNVRPTTRNDFWPPVSSVDLSDYNLATGPGQGIATGSGSGQPEKVFAQPPETYSVAAKTMWIQYQFTNDAPRQLAAYVLVSALENAGADPKEWRLLGSADGNNWTTLDERLNQTFAEREMPRLFTIAKPGSYNFYRLTILSNHGAEQIEVAGVQLLVEKPAKPKKPPGRKK